DHFARFIRATKVPALDGQLAATPQTRRGSELFEKVGCATCHVRALTTAPAGTKINGGKFTISDALGAKTFHPYSDFLMHNVGTGDGIVVPMLEHYGRRMYQTTWRNFSGEDFHNARFKVRTAPLWSVRLRSRSETSLPTFFASTSNAATTSTSRMWYPPSSTCIKPGTRSVGSASL